jgi:hypothetical protein
MGLADHDATPRPVRAALGSVTERPQHLDRRPAWPGSTAFHQRRLVISAYGEERLWRGTTSSQAGQGYRPVTTALGAGAAAAGGGLEPPTCCLQDSGESSAGCWRVLSLQLTSDRSSSQYAPVGPSSARWNDKQNDTSRRSAWCPVDAIGGARPVPGGPAAPMAPPIRAPPAALYQPLRPRRQVGSSGCRVGANGFRRLHRQVLPGRRFTR